MTGNEILTKIGENKHLNEIKAIQNTKLELKKFNQFNLMKCSVESQQNGSCVKQNIKTWKQDIGTGSFGHGKWWLLK